MTIEITHTEMIDGLEYFVFSGADYAWPPLPDVFWGGEKVRLSEDGFLVFRWNGQDVPMYEFGHHHLNDPHNRKNRYIVIIPGVDTAPYRGAEPGTTDVGRVIGFGSDGLDRLSTVFFYFAYPEAIRRRWSVCFLHGYGMGLFDVLSLGLNYPILQVALKPISANIDGEEILFPVDIPIHFGISAVQPTSWGQLKRSFLGTK